MTIGRRKKVDGPNSRESVSRRGFMSWLVVGWATFAAGLGGLGAIMMRFLAPNVLYEPQQTFRAGAASEYAPGEVSTRWKAKYGIWIVRLEDRIVALSTICTHLGCTPNWLASEQKFKCPCHGSAFRANGINFEGPAPRPLERHKITLDDEGVMIVDKTVSFRQERGQWDDPESFVAV
ncbi:MAG: ubiquinol-cytochrome c reductase iron-sulfur subunit [Kiritimatiellia bacterium]|jgi:cytochrome b6-f complex iron-sulfur subunit|nr:ubiquinol-cytochrome c reductase iron-sulfur subunit [Kiritimatiellia bacterium]MDP6630425.1 ubiquinol-cytochrome c reductase iron-sulfur subunit [Kiritimatiellia bacterium]MDP6809882.1 ubiquinol-cytochrome c reductase iron-sulfur subunit [Kiritimatiellia bacterium]MDP7024274.1 ubiquinol-cytochrome c reductase iron-sulfur subunit [Kiritimatiellia bacterium]